ncbi:MAG TPA: hypothetical protein VMC10_23695 [Stellaceae bacterium]|nr:hypothetical protein [Stellaceae bacterium]
MEKRWFLLFVAMALGLIAVVYFALWAFNGFHGLGLDLNATIALTLGTIGTAVLGVVLMALIFYSDRSGRDQDVHDIGEHPE